MFPEVFDPARPGFDAIIGNPPFLGGPKLRPALGFVYREYLSVNVSAERIADGNRVKRTGSSLDPTSSITWTPKRLIANQGVDFLGHHVNGMGFIMSDSEAAELRARDTQSAVVIHPYLVGQDLNSRPDCRQAAG